MVLGGTTYVIKMRVHSSSMIAVSWFYTCGGAPPPILPLLISYHLHLQLYHCSRQSGEPGEEVPINPMDAEPYDSKASPLLSTPKGWAKTGLVSTRATVTTRRRQYEPRPHFSMQVRREK